MIVQLLKPYLDRIEDGTLRDALREYLTIYEEKLDTFPASMSFHHTYTGGLKDHIIEVCRIAVTLYEEMRVLDIEVDSDSILTACMIHDMSKIIQEYLWDSNNKRWTKSTHLTKGKPAITHEILPIIDFPLITGYQLPIIAIKCVLSHMGGFSQSGVYPDTVEQAIVHSADLISSRMSPHVF